MGRDSISQTELRELERLALEVRKRIIRMIAAGGTGHVGGALSVTDILTALYFKVLRVDPARPNWPERDRLVLSAGHKCLALYSVLSVKGYFTEDLLSTYGCIESKLPGHPCMQDLPGVEANTGSLGHGLAIAGGMAMGLRLSGLPARVFAVMGDGELAEGSNWEAANASGHHQLDNLVAFVDRNGLQIGGKTAEVMGCEPLADRWRAFGWSVREINGHSYPEIVAAATDAPYEKGKPSAVIAHTVKSKGLPFAEGKAQYHDWTPTKEELAAAVAALEKAGEAMGA